MKAVDAEGYRPPQVFHLAEKELIRLRELPESSAVRPVIDLSFQLPETAVALRYFETGSVRGKLVIVVRE